MIADKFDDWSVLSEVPNDAADCFSFRPVCLNVSRATFQQRNKHIQRVLVEAAKLAPKQSHELALVYEKTKQKGKGNTNRATIAVARKMVTYMFAVDRANRPFVPTEKHSTAAP